MEEVWKDIEGYEGLYQVSNKGNVKSLNYNKTKKEKKLKPGIVGSGYLQVNLCKNKTIKHFLVHRLVANAFLPNPQNFPCVNHIDECKTNNVVTNIEWCTNKYNSNYGTCIQRCHKAQINGKRSKSVGAFKNGELVFTFPSTKEAGRQGFNQGAVASCCRCEIKSHKGYIWSYL